MRRALLVLVAAVAAVAGAWLTLGAHSLLASDRPTVEPIRLTTSQSRTESPPTSVAVPTTTTLAPSVPTAPPPTYRPWDDDGHDDHDDRRDDRDNDQDDRDDHNDLDVGD